MDGAVPPDVLLLADALPVSGLGTFAFVNLSEKLLRDDASFGSFLTTVTSPTNATDTAWLCNNSVGAPSSSSNGLSSTTSYLPETLLGI